MRHDFLCLICNHTEERRDRSKSVLDELWLDTAPMSLLARSQHQQTPSHEGTCEGFPDLAQNVVCCETAIRLKSGANRKCLVQCAPRAGQFHAAFLTVCRA